MMVADVEREADRLEALKSLEVLDTAPESEFDDLVGLAAAICGTPMSLVSLVDDKRQWFKAALGLGGVRETPREIAFCTHAIQQRELFVVEDACKDTRFAGNPLVTGSPNLRFYAGMPLATKDGFALGTLCVLDRRPRQLTDVQRDALRVLARQVSVRLEMRAQQKALDAALQEKAAVLARLQASEELFRTFMNRAPVASFIQDRQGNYVFRNELHREAFPQQRECPMPQQAGEGGSSERTETIERRDGQITHWRSFEFPCHDAQGETLLGCVAIEVTNERERSAEVARYQAELEAANDRLRNLAVTDGMTGLKNRRAFEERLAFEFSMARRKKRPLSVVLMDIDNFKKINDRLGHAAGDAVLQQVARVLQDTVRLTDLAVRFGGEEFAAILPESDERSALMWCRRLQKALLATEWEHQAVTISMGAAGMTSACLNGSQLVALSDQALYKAKREGKNCFVGAGALNIERAG